MYPNLIVSPLISNVDTCIECFNNYLNSNTLNIIGGKSMIQNFINLLLRGIEVMVIQTPIDIDKYIILWLSFDGVLYISTAKEKSNINIHISKLNAKIDGDDNTCVILYTENHKMWMQIRFETIDAAKLFTSYFNSCVIELNKYIGHHDIRPRQLSNTQWEYIENL